MICAVMARFAGCLSGIDETEDASYDDAESPKMQTVVSADE